MLHVDPEVLALVALGEPAADGERDHLATCPDCTAEIESLLVRPWDGFDAFVLVASASRRKDADEWVRSLVRMYRKWGERHRMEVLLLGERPPLGPSGGAVLLRVLGSNAYGYLQVEHGPHGLGAVEAERLAESPRDELRRHGQVGIAQHDTVETVLAGVREVAVEAEMRVAGAGNGET